MAMESVNNSVQTICGKLYLDSKTADVYFTFATEPDSDQIERVPAHKNILSVGSIRRDVLWIID